MKRLTVGIALAVLLMCAEARAHVLYFTLFPLGNGMVELEGMLSNGITLGGIPVRLVASGDGAVLWQGRTNELGACIFQAPEVPYDVELDAGPGHKAKGPGI